MLTALCCLQSECITSLRLQNLYWHTSEVMRGFSARLICVCVFVCVFEGTTGPARVPVTGAIRGGRRGGLSQWHNVSICMFFLVFFCHTFDSDLQVKAEVIHFF